MGSLLLLSPLCALAACIVLETCEQLAFALSGHRSSFVNVWTLSAIVIHILGLLSWMWVISLLPLGVALPLTGVNYVAVTFAARFVLKERLTSKRWAGIASIVVGMALIWKGAP